MDSERRVADYFIISGISDNFEHNIESRPFINSILPITDVTVIFKGLGEQCPIGYTCIETTPDGHVADLNNGNFKSQNIHICYRRGDDKPPLVNVGVFHEDKERLLPNVEIVSKTPYGRCASTGNSSSKSGTFITYSRAKTKNPYNQLVVVDLCIIFNNKNERAPHAFCAIRKNLNKSLYGMIGSEVFLCYKKTFLSPPSLCYTPQIVSRFPLQDYNNFPLPDLVPLFCLPSGVNIELRPTNVSLPRPLCTTFVLTSGSAQKMYGSALTFYEPFDQSLLTADQRSRLGIFDDDEDTISRAGSGASSPSQRQHLDTFVSKSICLLSRWPFFECFEKYLMFLYKLVFNPSNYSTLNKNSPAHNNIALEHHISHFLLDVSFPTPQRPTVLVQLMPGTDETVTISQPSSRLPLPLTGASFIQLLGILGVESTMDVLLFGLCEQKILLHSLNPWLLTGVAEAITAILFPFHWQCPYVPLCPLSLHGTINAPLPFIVGIDSRCFDAYTPPDDVICIDLDTKSTFLSDSKKCLNVRILPKRAARVLKSSLDKIYQKWDRISQAIGANQSPQHRSPTVESNRKQLEKRLELEIQEAFVRFMATILRGFRSYLLPITRAPTIGATDPTSLFDFDGFMSSRDRNYSQFYQLITRTQMFTRYIEERSFVSDKDTSLAFFDDCEEKLTASDDIFSDKPIKLFDKDDGIIPTDRSVFIPAPEQSPSVSLQSSPQQDSDEPGSPSSVQQKSCTTSPKRRLKFGPLNPTLFHRHPQSSNLLPLNRTLNGCNGNQDSHQNDSMSFNQILFNENLANDLNNTFSISRRTKQEIKTSQKIAKKSTETPIDWSKYLVSCCYCLWFSTLPSYIAYCKAQGEKKNDELIDGGNEDKSTTRILRYAHLTLVRMQKLQLTTDEICFRILTLLCGYHGQPALAVRVFFEMKKAGIKPNAVTYGYYNKAVLESRWPDHSSKPTTVLWTKIRNVISGITLFKSHGRMRRERRNKRPIQLIGDPNFYNYRPIDVVDRAIGTTNGTSIDMFRPTTLPNHRGLESIDHNEISTRSNLHTHRRSLVNRSFSTNQKSTIDINRPDYDSFSVSQDQDYNHKSSIHKSYSMQLRNDTSPERTLMLRVKSSSLEDDEDPTVAHKFSASQGETINPSLATTRKITSTHDLFLTLMQRHQLLADLGDLDQLSMNHVDLADNAAGLLFSTNPEYCRKVTRSVSQSLIQTKDEDDRDNQRIGHNNQVVQSNNLLLIGPENPQTHNGLRGPNADLLNASNFGEDAQILRKLVVREQNPHILSTTDDVGVLGLIRSHEVAGDNYDASSSDEAKNADQMSESTTDASEGTPSNEDDSNSMKNITSTPNFKLASLLNDASNLKWDKWTSSQSSKSVYKGIKSVATGFVSQFQEIKSSFSMSNNSATPSKLLTTAHHKSTTTREMLSQWANYFSSQPSQAGDDDSDTPSEGSNDLLRLSNEEDIEPSSSEANDFRLCYKLFDALEKHYNNVSSKEDLIDHLSANDDILMEHEDIAIEIKITTCSRCKVCNSLLYDEEIMERWTHNESNLNTKCIYCRAKIVPLMSIEVDDFRFNGEPVVQTGGRQACDEDQQKDGPTSDTTNDLVDLDFDAVQINQEPVTNDSQQPLSSNKKKRDSQSGHCYQQNYTVPYLSPIVLRKELESVFESSGDNCPASSRFIDEHPIIFWNLLWYFSRINVPTHLALLCLNAKSILNGREVPEEAKAMNKVMVRTLWDNDKLYAHMGKPLYRLLERGEPSLQVKAILCDDLHFTRNFLDQVINLIKSNELQKAMNLVLNARLKSSTRFSFDKNRHNLYRDLIFLINTYFGPGKLYMGKCFSLKDERFLEIFASC